MAINTGRTSRRYGAIALTYILSLPPAFLLALYGDRLVMQFPAIVHNHFKPSTSTQCVQVVRGMEKRAVIELFAGTREPEIQFDRGHRLLFMRSDGGCVVELDPESGRVRHAVFDPRFATLDPRATKDWR